MPAVSAAVACWRALLLQLKEDSSLEAITCRSCFMAALASWVDQQGGPRAVLANAAHLSNSKKLQLATWVGALCADDMGDGASSSSGSSSKGAQPYDSSFELPSSRHAALLQGRGFEEGKGWPLQYCSLRDGLSGLDLLLEVLERLPDDFTLPYYSELGQVSHVAACAVWATHSVLSTQLHTGHERLLGIATVLLSWSTSSVIVLFCWFTTHTIQQPPVHYPCRGLLFPIVTTVLFMKACTLKPAAVLPCGVVLLPGPPLPRQGHANAMCRWQQQPRQAQQRWWWQQC
jgi:hypothetical protein